MHYFEGSSHVRLQNSDDTEAAVAAACEVRDAIELESLRDRAVGWMQNPELPETSRLRWALVAITACQSKHACGASNSLASAIEIARVRSYAIRRFGPAPGDKVRDPQRLCTDVTEAIGAPPEEIIRRAEHWQDGTREEILFLRRVKNLLNTLEGTQHLVRNQLGSPGTDGQVWLDIVPLLP